MEIEYYKISRLSYLLSKLYEYKYRLRDLIDKSKIGLNDRALMTNLESDIRLIIDEVEPLFNEFRDSFGIKMNEVEEMRNNLCEALKTVEISKSYTGDEVRRVLDSIGIDDIPF